MKGYRIALVGHGGCHNRGCEAILRTTVAMLTSVLGKVSFIVPTLNYPFDIRLHPPIDSIRFVDAKPKRFALFLLPIKIRRRLFKLLGRNFTKQWRDDVAFLWYFIQRADAVISVGGDTYTEDYGIPEYYIQLLKFAKSLGRKTVIWGASIGPYLNVALRENMRQFLREVDLITVRESESLRYLQSLGISDNVRIVADPAFTLVPIASEQVNAIISRYSKSLLGINVSGLIASAKTPQAMMQLRNSFISFIERFLDETNGHILFIAHDIDERFPDSPMSNDHFFMQGILENVTRYDRIGIAPANMNAQETKSLISNCDYFIGAKTHATIAALSSLIPTISLAYSTKAVGVNLDIFGHTDYVLPKEDLNSNTLWQFWQRLVKDSILIRNTLANKIPEMQQRAMYGASYVSELISKKC